jgi:Ribonuclease G/E
MKRGKCRAKHEEARGVVTQGRQQELVTATRKLIYFTIVDFYDSQVAENVAVATLDVAGKIAAAMKGKDNKKVAEYSSALKIGNEY